MNPSRQELTKHEFMKTFVFPALLIFVIPFLTLLFFWHAQSRFDTIARDQFLESLRRERQLPDEQRAALVAYITEAPVSVRILDPEFAASVDPIFRFYYTTFRWLIRLSLFSIVSGVAVFLIAGISVWLSMRSQSAQYWSLFISWHVLRIYATFQTVLLGLFAVALSYWVTALWFEFYSLKLVFGVGFISAIGVWAVISAIFKKHNIVPVLNGTILDRESAPELWRELESICLKVNTSPPDRVIAGIDDNFFVTESPIAIADQLYRGRTLFVSLPLLKQLKSTEADAILAHEMAHFSGQDTMYSRRITPLLARFQIYLESLATGQLTWPVWRFMVCFWALFQLSLGKRSQQREFRADKIAADITSPRDIASSLLRVTAYSTFRRTVEADLFNQEKVLDNADVAGRIEREFAQFATEFAKNLESTKLELPHPFDSHPPMFQRFGALNVELEQEEMLALLAVSGDGGWFHRIPVAAELERQLWSAYEQEFLQTHHDSLAYRLLPDNVEDQVVVEAAFPKLSFEGQAGLFTLDFEKVEFADWGGPIYFRELVRWQFRDYRMLEFHLRRDGDWQLDLNINTFTKQQKKEILDAIQKYWHRHSFARMYQDELKTAAESEQVPTTSEE